MVDMGVGCKLSRDPSASSASVTNTGAVAMAIRWTVPSGLASGLMRGENARTSAHVELDSPGFMRNMVPRSIEG
jgi:hypothetical protein